MDAIRLEGLKKTFPKGNFTLDLPSLTVREGYITGFIGENGAGKTTTFKLVMGMLFPDEGRINGLGLELPADGAAFREQVGYVGSASGYLPYAPLKALKRMSAPFYRDWDEAAFERLANRFALPMAKKYKELSTGKQKQFALAMALAHHPRLLLMDEPTSGLDPLARQEILEILAGELQSEGVSVFFSTHITSDLDRVADYIQFLHGGRLLLDEERDALAARHRMVKGRAELLTPEVRRLLIAPRVSAFGFEALTDHPDEAAALLGGEAIYEKPTIEDLFVGYTQQGKGKSA